MEGKHVVWEALSVLSSVYRRRSIVTPIAYGCKLAPSTLLSHRLSLAPTPSLGYHRPLSLSLSQPFTSIPSTTHDRSHLQTHQAYGMVTSRAFEVGITAEHGASLVNGDTRFGHGQRLVAFIPVLDLLNCHVPSNCSEPGGGREDSPWSSSATAAAAALRPFQCSSGGLKYNGSHYSSTSYWCVCGDRRGVHVC